LAAVTIPNITYAKSHPGIQGLTQKASQSFFGNTSVQQKFLIVIIVVTTVASGFYLLFYSLTFNVYTGQSY